MLSPERTHGLGARESIAQEGHAMGGHWGGRGAKPALARGAFTVLFGMPVLRQAVRWGQGNALRLARADEHGGASGRIGEGLAMGPLTGETVGAMHSCGRNVVGPIEGTNRWAPRPRKGASRRGCSRASQTSPKTASR
jgi:hypothetical protein